MSEGGQWAWQSNHGGQDTAATAVAASAAQQSGQGVNQIEGMCLGGGIYSLGESGFKEAKPKMQKVVKWNKFEQLFAPSAQRAVTCHDHTIR